ncbi:hypothetical protein V9K67_00395 [Paraflavisolibacter sp. H34]|uniref:hypothetical protein n=1 Tax=Huijunlia imazamoxiresistens TaxID=3127457 RepID=UPI0030162381
MSCAACAVSVESRLKSVDGIKDAGLHAHVYFEAASVIIAIISLSCWKKRQGF